MKIFNSYGRIYLRKLTHLHHIVPKHMGCTNNPNNLIELTVAEHAAAHNWKTLEGRMGREEAIGLLLSGPQTKEHISNIPKALKGKPKSEEHKKAMRKPKNWTEDGKRGLSEASSSRKNMLDKNNRRNQNCVYQKPQKIGQTLSVHIAG